MPKTGGRTKKRGMKKGGYYSFSGDVGVAGGPNWTRHSEMGEHSISSRGGNTHYGSGRKRKGKKGKKSPQICSHVNMNSFPPQKKTTTHTYTRMLPICLFVVLYTLLDYFLFYFYR